MPKKPTPFKIELTGQADGPIDEVARRGQDNLTLLLEVMRTIAKDFGVVIDYPAMIYLDDDNDNSPILDAQQ